MGDPAGGPDRRETRRRRRSRPRGAPPSGALPRARAPRMRRRRCWPGRGGLAMTGALLPVTPPPRAVLDNLPAWIEPLDALRRARGRRHPVLLLSGLEGHPASRFSILAWDPLLVVSIRGAGATLIPAPALGGSIETRHLRDPFDFLRSLAPAGALQGAAPGVPFAGGAIGYLGYGLRRAVERLPVALPDPLGQPDAWFGLYDHAAGFDHRERRGGLVATGLGAEDERQREIRAAAGLRDLRDVLAGPPAPSPPAPSAAGRVRRAATLHTEKKDYLRSIARALDYIAAGDLYQVNLSHRIEC